MNTIRDPTTGRAWSAPRELVDYIESAYHGYLRLTLPVLDALTEHIAREHSISLGQMDRLQRLCTALEDNLESHMARQECRLFPTIRHLREPVGDTAWASRQEDSLEELMSREEHENRDARNLIKQIEEVVSHPAWADRGYNVEQLRSDVAELHENLANHFHLETEVLFPAVREMLQGHALAV